MFADKIRVLRKEKKLTQAEVCLLYTSDAADEL